MKALNLWMWVLPNQILDVLGNPGRDLDHLKCDLACRKALQHQGLRHWETAGGFSQHLEGDWELDYLKCHLARRKELQREELAKEESAGHQSRHVDGV